MSPRGVPVTEAEQAQNDLLAQLGLTASASPDDVDRLHEAASEFLASAPPHLRGWAHAQVAALDAAYLKLTDPVGLEGSALRSPTSPSVVVPGGPATPPVRRDLLDEEVPAAVDDDADDIDVLEGPAEAASPEDVAAAIAGEPDAEDLAALYASVTPSAHADMAPSAKRPTKKERREVRKATAAAKGAPVETAPAAVNPWKRLYIATVGIAAVALVGVIGFNVLGSATAAPISSGSNSGNGGAQASPAAPAVDQAKVGELMASYQADPTDLDTLLALADEFYAGQDYATAGTWLDKVIEIDAKHVKALLARGAAFFNLGDLENAKVTWEKVVAIEPDNQEAHYDLGFYYLNLPEADWAGVQREWNRVVEIDPTSDLATTVKSHLESMASMMPGASGAPTSSAAPSTGASAAPSAAPAASPAAGGTVIQQTAANVQFGTASLSAKAGTPFTINFKNNDTGVQHDIVIEDSTGKRVFTGALIDGGTETDYQVSALPAGTYTFTCSIHPIMTGTLTVGG